MNGIYIVHVTGKENKFSLKIISNGNHKYKNDIQYVGQISINNYEKSAETEEPGVIHFFVYSGNKITKIADSPSESKTYEVEFYECKDADGKNYPIVQIGEQWWMAENLAYNVGYGCWVYDNDENNLAKYGRLYTLETAKTTCPSGWHLPTDDEWKQLEMAIGMSQSEADDTDWRGTNEGTKLKTTSGWNNNGSGIDNFGFSGLPGGELLNGGNGFQGIGYYSLWWSATERSTSESAWYRSMQHNRTNINRYGHINGGNGMSVRCVKE